MLLMMNNSFSGPLPDLNFQQYHDLHGACAFAGFHNSYCAPLPAGISKCNTFEKKGIATHAC
jgi:hypothetical protein